MEASVWHPLKNMNFKAFIKYDKNKVAVEIKYMDGYKVTEPSYIEDILFESNLLTKKSITWI